MRFNNTYSAEENQVDPNTDKNPLIENANDNLPEGDEPEVSQADVSLDTSPEIEGGKSEDTVETNVTVRELDKEINNDFKESDNIIAASEALDAISVEMRAVVAEQGKLSPGDLFVLNRALTTFGAEQMPVSMESLTSDGMLYTGTCVAIESLTQSLNKFNTGVDLFIESIIKKNIALVNTITPLLDRKIKKAVDIKSALDNSNREAGLKEVSGSFVDDLVIEGSAPNGSTVVKTVDYLGQCIGEVLTTKLIDDIEKTIKPVFNSVAEIANADWEGTYKPSRLGMGVLLLMSAAAVATGSLFTSTILSTVSALMGVNEFKKTVNSIRVDPNLIVNLHALCPTVSKIDVVATSAAPILVKRSLPLFGNKAILVAQYNAQLNEKTTKDSKYAVPGISLVNISNVPGAKTMQALTAGEQQQAITRVIANLTQVREFYKGYPARATAYMRVLKTANASLKPVERVIAGGRNQWSAAVYRNALMMYSRTYLEEVVGRQSAIARYAIKVNSAVVSLVEASSNVAKANTGSVSNEEMNPFL